MYKASSSLAVIALMLSLAACGPKTEQKVDAAANDTSEVLADAGNTASDAVHSARDALAPTPSGQEFIDKAAQSDAFEIAAAKLALTNAASSGVKNFARDMTKAHTESTAKIKTAARQSAPRLTPQATLTDDQNTKLADLSKLTGADFDRNYMSGQVKAHEDALALMENYAKNGEVAPLKTAAGEIAPIVQGHLDMARSLNR